MSEETTTTTPSQHPDHEGSWMPKSVLRFYSKFPLVLLPAETSTIVEKITEPTLWVSFALSSITHHRVDEAQD